VGEVETASSEAESLCQLTAWRRFPVRVIRNRVEPTADQPTWRAACRE
jgi:hypothetical protein